MGKLKFEDLEPAYNIKCAETYVYFNTEVISSYNFCLAKIESVRDGKFEREYYLRIGDNGFWVPRTFLFNLKKEENHIIPQYMGTYIYNGENKEISGQIVKVVNQKENIADAFKLKSSPHNVNVTDHYYFRYEEGSLSPLPTFKVGDILKKENDPWKNRIIYIFEKLDRDAGFLTLILKSGEHDCYNIGEKIRFDIISNSYKLYANL